MLQHQLVLVEHHVRQMGQLQRVLIHAEIASIHIVLVAALIATQMAHALQYVRLFIANGPVVEPYRLVVHRQSQYSALNTLMKGKGGECYQINFYFYVNYSMSAYFIRHYFDLRFYLLGLSTN